MNRKDTRSFISECRKNSLIEMGDLFFEKFFEAETEADISKLLINIQNDGKVKEKFKKMYLYGKRSFITLKELKYNHQITEKAVNIWLCWLLSVFNNELSNYITLKDQYEKYVIKQDYSNANILLSEIENISGISLWSTSQKLYLEEQINGFEANKKLLSSLIGQKSVIPILGILLEGYSSMAEKTMGYMNYEASLKEYKKLDIISDYIEFKLDLEYDRIPICENIIIQLASQINIVDVFEDYLRLIQYKVVYGDATIEDIAPLMNIKDNRIFNLKSIMMLVSDEECEQYLNQNSIFYHALDIYTAGNYENAKVELQRYIKDSPDDIQAIILYVKTCINLKINLDEEDKLINDIYNLYLMQNDIKQIEFNLLMFAKSHYLLSYGCKLINLVHKKLNSKVSENLQRFVHINDLVITPNFVTMIKDNIYQKKFLDKFNGYCPATVQLFLFLTNNIENLPSSFNIDPFRMQLFTAFYKMNNNSLDETIVILEDLLLKTNHSDFYHYEKVCRLLYNVYAKTFNYYSMMILVVNSYFLNNNLINRLDLKEIISNIAFTKNKEIKSSIYYPIFTYLYDNNDITKHNISYRNFKDYNLLKTPDDLLEIDTSKYGLEKVIFFLYHVCTIKIMKSDSSLIRSKIDIEEMRVNILRKLINYNPDASKIYFQEMSEIITKKRIRTRAKQLSNLV
jgi:hypothetical protein